MKGLLTKGLLMTTTKGKPVMPVQPPSTTIPSSPSYDAPSMILNRWALATRPPSGATMSISTTVISQALSAHAVAVGPDRYGIFTVRRHAPAVGG
jgi:hypothetical protein